MNLSDYEQAMREERYEAAIAAADLAIGALLHDGLDVESFVRLSLQGAQIEGLMRVDRDAVARLRRLHAPIAVRWEALRRCGREVEAREMRAVCILHFSDRVSVWEAAGNQALDEGERERAEHYFDRGLALDPNSTSSLAGKAIVLELRKDWTSALTYRERVVGVERSLERDDIASLQRTIRYAAALGRVGRWREARVLFRRCVALRAFEQLPAERPVLLRVFSNELYSPALLAVLKTQVPEALAEVTPDVSAALREAAVLGATYTALRSRAGMEPAERLLLLGMCAWLAGDHARAYALLDEAEVHNDGDLATQFLLASCAIELLAPESPSIVRYAIEAASAAIARGTGDEGDRFYARVMLDRFDSSDNAPRPSNACPGLAGPDLPVSLPAQVRRLVAYRVEQRNAGHSARDIARSSAEALAALEIAAAAVATGPSS